MLRKSRAPPVAAPAGTGPRPPGRRRPAVSAGSVVVHRLDAEVVGEVVEGAAGKHRERQAVAQRDGRAALTVPSPPHTPERPAAGRAAFSSAAGESRRRALHDLRAAGSASRSAAARRGRRCPTPG